LTLSRVQDIYVRTLESSPRLQGLSLEKRKKIIGESVERMTRLGIFEPLHLSWEDDDDEFVIQDDEAVEAASRLKDRNAQIRMKQIALKIKPMEGEDDVSEASSDYRWGRTQLHEAVAMNDIVMAEKLIKEGHDITAKDNNGHTPIHIAVIEENKEMIVMFRQVGIKL